jgi:alkylated DNA repair protein (DNA oxidative demethylase)
MDLFTEIQAAKFEFAENAFLLKGFANDVQILADLQAIISAAPLRHMMTPMGFAMSAAMTNCGQLGWVSDKNGYRYDALNPNTGVPWQPMPASFLQLATSAAAECGFANFVPDACLINQYKVGASMGLHQDKNELDFTQPIVSVSLGIPAVFQFGGLKRNDKTLKIPLTHGDVVVWGGDSRLKFHGIMPLRANNHEVLGAYRYNLTFRKAG